MTKKLDSDIKALRAAVRALNGSSSQKMLKANLEFLWDRYIEHPARDVRQRFAAQQPAQTEDAPTDG